MIEVTNTLAEELAFDLLQSYPEVSSEWIKCVNWAGYNVPDCTDYSLDFKCLDGTNDDGIYYPRTVNTKDMVTAVLAMHDRVKNEKWRVVSLDRFWDADEWDAIAIDCLMQIHFYGDVIYG